VTGRPGDPYAGEVEPSMAERYGITDTDLQEAERPGDPPLTPHELAALQALTDYGHPITGMQLAARMRRTGGFGPVTLDKAHAAGALLAEAGLAVRTAPDGGDPIRYEITTAGRARLDSS
jgi:hypothetical protein